MLISSRYSYCGCVHYHACILVSSAKSVDADKIIMKFRKLSGLKLAGSIQHLSQCVNFTHDIIKALKYFAY